MAANNLFFEKGFALTNHPEKPAHEVSLEYRKGRFFLYVPRGEGEKAKALIEQHHMDIGLKNPNCKVFRPKY